MTYRRRTVPENFRGLHAGRTKSGHVLHVVELPQFKAIGSRCGEMDISNVSRDTFLIAITGDRGQPWWQGRPLCESCLDAMEKREVSEIEKFLQATTVVAEAFERLGVVEKLLEMRRLLIKMVADGELSSDEAAAQWKRVEELPPSLFSEKT